jgi:hypothetical protein
MGHRILIQYCKDFGLFPVGYLFDLTTSQMVHTLSLFKFLCSEISSRFQKHRYFGSVYRRHFLVSSGKRYILLMELDFLLRADNLSISVSVCLREFLLTSRYLLVCPPVRS